MKHEMVETASQAWAPCGAPSLVWAVPKRSPYYQPPPLAGSVGGGDSGDIGEEGECRPLLLYANPLDHHVPATLFIARFRRNDISGDHCEMISKVAFGVSRPGGGYTGCVGVNVVCIPQWFKERGVFWSPPPFKGPKCVGVSGSRTAPGHPRCLISLHMFSVVTTCPGRRPHPC